MSAAAATWVHWATSDAMTAWNRAGEVNTGSEAIASSLASMAGGLQPMKAPPLTSMHTPVM